MKATRFLLLTGMVLIGLFLTTRVEAFDLNKRQAAKKSVEITVDKPLIEYMVKAYADQIDANDIVRAQKMLSQVDHITITFTDKDAVDYVLKFKPISEEQLEAWMFDAGYLSADYKGEPDVVVPWMEQMDLK